MIKVLEILYLSSYADKKGGLSKGHGTATDDGDFSMRSGK
nr:hypothetical protein [Tanacetum cinerariifolium]